MADPDIRVVSVFRTDDPAVLPLATIALEAEGIEYEVRDADKQDSYEWQMSQPSTTLPRVMEIVVASDVAAKARDLLVDLERSPSAAAGAGVPPGDPPTVTLEEAGSGRAIGTVTESQLQNLTAHMEEEAPQQYFVTPATIEMLQDAGVEPAVVDMLRTVAASQPEGVSVRWVVK